MPSSTPDAGLISMPPPGQKLQYVESWAADVDLLVRNIKQQAQAQGHLKILEAGCGRRWSLNLDGVAYTLTGIDLDPAALKIRMEELRDLHDGILGDLCTPGLIPRDTYDVVYSSYVLEHIPEAEIALENMVQGLKRGGILILRIPDPDGVWGWTAEHTPLSVHVAYYKFVLKYANAGKPGFGPYPTCYAKVVSRQGLRDFCERHNCTIVEERGHNYYLRARNLATLATRIYAQALSFLSLGSLAWRHNNLTYVIRKN
jgi:SAM-dependent methyltransferase